MPSMWQQTAAKLSGSLSALWLKTVNAIRYPRLNSGPRAACGRKCLGSDYARFCVCPDNITRTSIVYSFGVGEDITFDLAMIEEFGVDVFAFDPTPRSINWIQSQQLPQKFHFFPFGVADFDGVTEFFPPENPDHISHTVVYRQKTAEDAIRVNFYRLKTIQSMLNHERIHVLKLNIEGAEYAVINDMTTSGANIDQLLVEFHHRFENLGMQQTKKAIELLNANGYKAFYSSHRRVYSFIRQAQ